MTTALLPQRTSQIFFFPSLLFCQVVASGVNQQRAVQHVPGAFKTAAVHSLNILQLKCQSDRKRRDNRQLSFHLHPSYLPSSFAGSGLSLKRAAV